MFFFEDAVGERVSGIGIEDRDGSLQDDRAAVQLLIHEVDRAAGNLDAMRPRLILGIETRKGGQQRRMDVENAIRRILERNTRSTGACSRRGR